MTYVQKSWRMIVLALLLSSVSGFTECYKPVTKSGLPKRIRTIAVPAFQNQALRYKIETRFTEAVIKEIIRRGRGLRVQGDREGADAVIDGVIKSFSFSGVLLDDQGRARDIVEIVVKEGPERIREIIDWGTRFDKDGAEYDLGREGGHTENRILHFKDLTGWEIQRALVAEMKKHANIHIHEHYFAIDIITQHHLGWNITRLSPDIECYGCYALNKKTGEIETFLAKKTLMATGGTGQVYRNTTNPIIASGDGIAMVYRAKGRVADMEFVQFHPTALYNPSGDNPNFLVNCVSINN